MTHTKDPGERLGEKKFVRRSFVTVVLLFVLFFHFFASRLCRNHKPVCTATGVGSKGLHIG